MLISPFLRNLVLILVALFGLGSLGVIAQGPNGSGRLIATAYADDDDHDGIRRHRGNNPEWHSCRYGAEGYRRYRDDDDDGIRNRRTYKAYRSRDDDDDDD